MNNNAMIERAIVDALIINALADGLTVIADNGEEPELESRDVEALKEHLFAVCDVAHLIFVNGTGKRQWVMLVFGNGCDVISDYGVSLEDSEWFQRVLHACEQTQAWTVDIKVPTKAEWRYEKKRQAREQAAAERDADTQ